MNSTMRPEHIKPNEFELAILDRLSNKEPALLGAVGQLHVLTREFTGVESYANFACEDSSADAPNKHVEWAEQIAVPGVPNGMGAVLFCKGDRPSYLEVITYGDDHCESIYNGFTIEETA